MRWRTLLLTAALFWPVLASAQALRLPQFSQCVSGGPSGTALVRSSAADPAINFVSTTEAGLALGKRVGVKTYLTRKGDGSWRLWVVYNAWESNTLVPIESELVVGGAGEAVRSNKRRENGDNHIFEIDPAELLAAYPGATRVEYAFRQRDKDGVFTKRKLLKAELDLARLRSLLAELPGVERSDAACRNPAAEIDQVIDPKAYNECRIDTYGGDHLSVLWQGNGVSIQWQPHLSKWAYLNADQWVKSDELEAALAQPLTPDKPGLLGGLLPISLHLDWFGMMKLGKLKLAQQLSLIAQFSGDWGQYESEARVANGGLNREVVGNAYRSKGELMVTILSPGRVELDRSTLPAHAIPEAEARLRLMLADLAQRLPDPVANCQTPYSIVVT